MNISFPDVSWENLGEEDVPSKVHMNLVFRATKQEAIDDTKCIAFEASIMKLLHTAVGSVVVPMQKVTDIHYNHVW